MGVWRITSVPWRKKGFSSKKLTTKNCPRKFSWAILHYACPLKISRQAGIDRTRRAGQANQIALGAGPIGIRYCYR